jgi:putative tryptophan/tyrosine transport system substrate-binding protein
MCYPSIDLSVVFWGWRHMRRRKFIALIGSVTVWPFAVLALESEKRPTIGFLGATTPTIWSSFVAAFLQRLRELGWIDGYNLGIEYRWAEGREDRYHELAADLVRRKVDVIVTGGTSAVLAVKQATSVIPIVFATAGDPLGTGLVASLSRPGGNVTGLSNQQTDLAGYRLELLHELVPDIRRVALLGNVASPNVVLEMNAVQAAAPKLGLETIRLEVEKAGEIVPAIESLKGRADALYVCTDPLLTVNQVSINTLAIRERLPTINAFRQYVEAGALMSYGPNFPDLFRRAGDLVDKILHGAKPSELPVEQPVKFDLIINLTTARALGLTIPESFLVRAQQVIE